MRGSGVSLLVEKVYCGYDDAEVLHGVSLTVEPGEIVGVLGSNAAGKTTLLRAICGSVSVTGRITFGGTDLTKLKPHEIARLGIASVFGRDVFAPLSVRDNLLLAGRRLGRAELLRKLAEMHELFPSLLEMRERQAGTLSGGQQQMLALAMALVSEARLTLLDEPSMGLSPKLVSEFLNIVASRRMPDTAVLLVEQNAVEALRIVDRAYVLERGSVVHVGTSDDLTGEGDVRRAYLGL